MKIVTVLSQWSCTGLGAIFIEPMEVGWSYATWLAHFGRFIAEYDQALGSFAGLGRQAHIEPYLNYVARALNPKNDLPFTVSYQVQLIVILGWFFRDITE